MPERITCHLCPLEGKCPKTLETNMAEIAKFLNAFEDSYPNEIKIASLVDNQGVLTYTTSPSDKANRRRRMQKWLSNENSTNDGFAYYLEFLLVQLLKQMISGKNLSNIEVTLTPTQLDCVHQGDGNGGDVIITQGNYPLVLIDVTIANLSKKQNFGMHYPTGSPVI
ncbi:MAG: hypothetical protein NZM26_03225 [Patescibacteria group bacterium]|nr:hypothetical protein [Patescibacteria group bacterium]